MKWFVSKFIPPIRHFGLVGWSVSLQEIHNFWQWEGKENLSFLFPLPTYFWISVDKYLMQLSKYNLWIGGLIGFPEMEMKTVLERKKRNWIDLQKPGADTGNSNAMGNNGIDTAEDGFFQTGGSLRSMHIGALRMFVKMQIPATVRSEFWSGPGSWELALLIGFINDYYMEVWELLSQTFENLQQAGNS